MKKLTPYFNTTLMLGAVLMFSTLNALSQNSRKSAKIYQVPKVSTKITIDGKANEQSWTKAKAYPFNHFYKLQKPEDKQSTSLKMLWDEENLYLFYQCKDKYITARMKDRDGSTFLDDCAEIFLIPAPKKIDMHFGFELNLYKTANDFVFINKIYDKNRMVVKSFNPDYTAEVTIDGTLNDNSDIDTGWTMEMAIPLKTFHIAGSATPIADGVKWFFMAVRQDRNEVAGQRVTTSTIFPLSGRKKNVHNPKDFGILEFLAQ